MFLCVNLKKNKKTNVGYATSEAKLSAEVLNYHFFHLNKGCISNKLHKTSGLFIDSARLTFTEFSENKKNKTSVQLCYLNYRGWGRVEGQIRTRVQL